MNAETSIQEASLAKMREPFPANQISKLPKESRSQIDARKGENGRGVMVFNCQVCGGHHHKDAVHLDYVGHAALTDRLLDTDIEWSWEPVGFTENGLPALDHNGGLWIKLTVCGVTRYGYGAADGKSGGDAIKEIIGDALRNAAMRFGAALELWHKGDLHGDDSGDTGAGNDNARREPAARERLDGPHTSKTALRKAVHDIIAQVRAAETVDDLDKLKSDHKRTINQAIRDWPMLIKGDPDIPEDLGFKGEIEKRRGELTRSAEYQFLVSTVDGYESTAELRGFLTQFADKVEELDGEESRLFEAHYDRKLEELKALEAEPA